MIDCKEAGKKLYSYLDREIDKETTQSLLDHLEKCQDCFQYAEFQKALRMVLIKFNQKITPTPQFNEQIYQVLRQTKDIDDN